MLSVKRFFKLVFDVDVTERPGDIHTDILLGFRGKDDEPVEVATPMVLQTIAVGLFMVWKRFGYTIGNMAPDYFCAFFDELLREVFQTKLKELENEANESGEGGEVISLMQHKFEDKKNGES